MLLFNTYPTFIPLNRLKPPITQTFVCVPLILALLYNHNLVTKPVMFSMLC